MHNRRLSTASAVQAVQPMWCGTVFLLSFFALCSLVPLSAVRKGVDCLRCYCLF